MMRTAFTILLLVFVTAISSTVSSPSVYANSPNTEESRSSYAPGRLIVKYRSNASGVNFASIAPGIKSRQRLDRLNVEVLSVDESQIEEVFLELSRNPNVVSVNFDPITRPASVLNDPKLVDGTQWALNAIEAPVAWDSSQGENTVIAVLDSGIDAAHPDLADRLVAGYNFIDNNVDTTDRCGHGTHLAGVVAATANNGIGIAGIAHYAYLMPVKIMSDTCSGSYTLMIRGIYHAVDNGADVIVISSGATIDLDTLHDAIAYARESGVLVVTAAGNNGTDASFYPGSYPESFNVSGTNIDDSWFTYSNYGSDIDISAPANSIYSTYLDSAYVNMSGTSMAAPHVAAIAGLVLALRPNLSVADVEQIIMNSADDLGENNWDPYYGYGRINARAAVELTSGTVPTPTPPPISDTTPTPQPTPTPEITPTPTPVPDASSTSHIGDLDGRPVPVRKKWQSEVVISVHDENGQAVDGATIDGIWSGDYDGQGMCVTGTDGTCVVESGTVRAQDSIMNFVVSSVKHPNLPYIAAANCDPDGDSDGTTIKVTFASTDTSIDEDPPTKKLPPGLNKDTSTTSLDQIHLFLPMMGSE